MPVRIVSGMVEGWEGSYLILKLLQYSGERLSSSSAFPELSLASSFAIPLSDTVIPVMMGNTSFMVSISSTRMYFER